jgi:hypothetical protein
MSGKTMTPVGPLLELVHDGRKHKSAQKSRASAVWAEVLGVDANSPEFVRLIADVNRMMADLMVVVSSTTITERARENYLGTLREILKVFQPPALNQVFEHTLKNLLVDQHVASLENLDSQLAHLHPSPRMGDEQVQKIRADVDRVLELLDGCDLPPELARLLRSHVEAIRRVVQHYRIYGNEGLHDQLRRVLWDLNLHHEDFKRHEESRAVRAYKSLVAKATIFSRMLGDAASAITVGEAIKRLFGP